MKELSHLVATIFKKPLSHVSTKGAIKLFKKFMKGVNNE